MAVSGAERRLGWRQGKPRGARAVPLTANPPESTHPKVHNTF
ncbi:hypothetical protein XAC2852_810049 [Xanthomonas citri pv. citri]|nr:hypothetical protein XAC902_1050035 [Xanthomonas citri pv. citri]CEE21668.1 hypothetical protein XAC908_1060036 [Xanthomonas citri pv. citri]CEE81445.1 hypothetical protein XAC2852_810049 [Xanthomonas citri pv. citri]CEE89288.1 hypothetical protein XAC3218_920036 [Xanthomonas citri pv. citri]CEF47149.1 hypothetical protein XAC217_810031 [Xanthomonas citri pv. citri]